jgi:secreted trypsin-like serine protease
MSSRSSPLFNSKRRRSSAVSALAFMAMAAGSAVQGAPVAMDMEDAGVHLHKRIIDGTPLPKILPWMVSIQDGDGNHFCGGSLIAPNLVLSAAHCFHDPMRARRASANRFDLRKDAAEEGGVSYDVTRMIIHPQFDKDTFANDVAIIEVVPSEGFEELAKDIQPVKLDETNAGLYNLAEAARMLQLSGISTKPQALVTEETKREAINNTFDGKVDATAMSSDQVEKLAAKLDEVQHVDNRRKALNEKLFVAGWGVTDQESKTPSAIANRAEMKTTPVERCRQVYNMDKDMDENVLCAIGGNFKSDSCQGDSGGPLYTENEDGTQTLVGAVSFGVGCGNREIQKELAIQVPAVYTRVYKYSQNGFFNAAKNAFSQQ